MTETVSAPVRRSAVFHPLVVADVERLTDDAVAVTFAVPDELAEDFRFANGQHLTVRLPDEPGDVRRNYSICSPEGGALRIGVKRVAGGRFSTWATDELAPGSVVEVMPPTGRFSVAVQPARPRHYAAVAAGSGITPILSIAATVLEVEPASRVTLLYANRSAATVMFLEELEDLKDRFPGRFHLVHLLSREQQDVELFSGRLTPERFDRILTGLLPPQSVDEWLLCGPFELVEGARSTLARHGVDPRHVHQELFHVEAEPPRRARPVAATDEPAGGAEITVRLDGRVSSFRLGFDAESVLDALLRVRADAPFACKGGVCGTCRARLVEGEVDMDRRYALEDDELAAGFVLACQSHPTTPRVVLSFDE